MIPYEELAAALTRWRARQGLPTGPADFLGEAPPATFDYLAAQPAGEAPDQQGYGAEQGHAEQGYAEQGYAEQGYAEPSADQAHGAEQQAYGEQAWGEAQEEVVDLSDEMLDGVIEEAPADDASAGTAVEVDAAYEAAYAGEAA